MSCSGPMGKVPTGSAAEKETVNVPAQGALAIQWRATNSGCATVRERRSTALSRTQLVQGVLERLWLWLRAVHKKNRTSPRLPATPVLAG